jgi:hypothetical protein
MRIITTSNLVLFLGVKDSSFTNSSLAKDEKIFPISYGLLINSKLILSDSVDMNQLAKTSQIFARNLNFVVIEHDKAPTATSCLLLQNTISTRCSSIIFSQNQLLP